MREMRFGFRIQTKALQASIMKTQYVAVAVVADPAGFSEGSNSL